MGLLSHSGVKWISLGWSAFILENVLLSHNREYIIDRFGSNNYHLTYNVLSTAACSSILYGYFKHGRGCGPIVKSKGLPGIAISFALQSVGFIIVSQQVPKLQMPFEKKAHSISESLSTELKQQQIGNYFVRCPMDFRPKDIPQDGIFGTMRISRHATFWSFGSICLGEAVASIFLPEIVMFSFPMIFAIIGTSHQDYRYRRNSGGILTPEMDAITSNIPFIALLSGKQSWSSLYDEIKWSNAGIGVAVAIAFALRNIRRLK